MRRTEATVAYNDCVLVGLSMALVMIMSERDTHFYEQAEAKFGNETSHGIAQPAETERGYSRERTYGFTRAAVTTRNRRFKSDSMGSSFAVGHYRMSMF